jgi:hypothetical protein
VATKLSVYQGALRELGERKLSGLTENREPRRLLDDVYDDGLLQCLAMEQWRFAVRTVELTRDTSIEPSYGYQNAYEQPTDFVRTYRLCSDEYQRSPLLDYTTEGRWVYADIEPIYWSYVSDDAGYGLDLSRWPPNFTMYVETFLAHRIANRMGKSKDDQLLLKKLMQERKTEASSTDAMEGPTEFMPPGSWVLSRGGRRSWRWDRGSRSRLFG